MITKKGLTNFACQRQKWYSLLPKLQNLIFFQFFSPVRSVMIVAPGDPIPPHLQPQQKLQLQQMSSDHPPPIEDAGGAPSNLAITMTAASNGLNSEMYYG